MKERHYLTESDVEKVRHMIEVECLQMWKVADEIGVHLATIQKLCKILGLKTQRSGSRSGELHKGWKGGRVLSKGYWEIYCPGHPNARKWTHYIPEHRLVMEKVLGRYLLPSEVVHHRDGNRQNNDLENLVVFQTNAEHLKEDLKGRCPNWTPEGWKKLLESAAKKRKYEGTKAERAKQAQKVYDSTHHRKRVYAPRSPRSIAHPPSLPDSTS